MTAGDAMAPHRQGKQKKQHVEDSYLKHTSTKLTKEAQV